MVFRELYSFHTFSCQCALSKLRLALNSFVGLKSFHCKSLVLVVLVSKVKCNECLIQVFKAVVLKLS